jgi:hypothetical protein
MEAMDAVLARIEAGLCLTAGSLTTAQLSSGPPGKWTCAQIIEHLGRAFSGTAAGAQRAVDAGRPLAGRPSPGQRAAVFIVVELGYFPSGRTSPKVAEPLGADPAAVLDGTLGHLRAMDDRLARVEHLFGASVRVLDHPILGPLSVRQWRRFHWIHTRHHLEQIAARMRADTRRG